MKKDQKLTGVQDAGRNEIMGAPTSDKVFKDQKTLKRHKGLPNAGGRSADSGARTDNEKNRH